MVPGSSWGVVGAISGSWKSSRSHFGSKATQGSKFIKKVPPGDHFGSQNLRRTRLGFKLCSCLACFFRDSFFQWFFVISGALAGGKNRQNHWRFFQNQGFRHTRNKCFGDGFGFCFGAILAPTLDQAGLQSRFYRVRKRRKKNTNNRMVFLSNSLKRK